MGVGRIFQGGALRDFSKIFLGGKKWQICFFPLKAKKTNLFAKIFKIQGGQGPLASLPTPIYVDATWLASITTNRTTPLRQA